MPLSQLLFIFYKTDKFYHKLRIGIGWRALPAAPAENENAQKQQQETSAALPEQTGQQLGPFRLVRHSRPGLRDGQKEREQARPDSGEAADAEDADRRQPPGQVMPAEPAGAALAVQHQQRAQEDLCKILDMRSQ